MSKLPAFLVGIAAAMVTHTLDFMTDQTFGALNKQVSDLTRTTTEQTNRISELEATLPLGKLYPPNFTKLLRFDTDRIGPTTFDLGPCVSDDCYKLKVATVRIQPNSQVPPLSAAEVDIIFNESSSKANATIKFILTLAPECYLEFITSESLSRLVVESVSRDSARFGVSFSPVPIDLRPKDRGTEWASFFHRSGPSDRKDCIVVAGTVPEEMESGIDSGGNHFKR